MKYYTASDIITLGTLKLRIDFMLANSVVEGDLPYNGILGIASPFNPYRGNGVFPRILRGYAHRIIYIWTMKFRDPIDVILFPSVTGEISLGLPNPTRYVGIFVWLPLIPSGYWMLRLDGISFGGAQKIDTSRISNAIIDSGTTLIDVPRSMFAEILKLHPFLEPYNSQEDTYVTSCENVHKVKPFIVFLSGRRFSLSAEQLFVEYSDGTCMVAFYPIDGDVFIFGLRFLSAFYVAFNYDQKQIGFATPIN